MHIFISYRRADTYEIATRLHDRLVKEFGRGAVFIDWHNDRFGTNILGTVYEKITRARIILVLIGDQWLTVTEDDGTPRLQLSDDVVRTEVTIALHRDGARTIPVLVDNVSMPRNTDLPEPLRPLRYKLALRLRSDEETFEQDCDALIKSIRRYIKTISYVRLALYSLVTLLILGTIYLVFNRNHQNTVDGSDITQSIVATTIDADLSTTDISGIGDRPGAQATRESRLGSDTPTPSATPTLTTTYTPTHTHTDSPSPTSSNTHTHTTTSSLTWTPSPSPSHTTSSTATSSQTSTVTPTHTHTPSPTDTSSPTSTPTRPLTPTPQPSPGTGIPTASGIKPSPIYTTIPPYDDGTWLLILDTEAPLYDPGASLAGIFIDSADVLEKLTPGAEARVLTNQHWHGEAVIYLVEIPRLNYLAGYLKYIDIPHARVTSSGEIVYREPDTSAERLPYRVSARERYRILGGLTRSSLGSGPQYTWLLVELRGTFGWVQGSAVLIEGNRQAIPRRLD